MNITFTEQELNIVLNALAQRPFAVSILGWIAIHSFNRFYIDIRHFQFPLIGLELQFESCRQVERPQRRGVGLEHLTRR